MGTMTEKELKRLSRIELLELMVEQGKKIEELNTVIEDQEALLADRTIRIEKCGTIAEASFALNSVLEAAQEAAEQYLINIAQRSSVVDEECNRKEEEVDRICSEKMDSISSRCDAMLASVEESCASLKAQTEAECTEKKLALETACNELRAKVDAECTQRRSEADAYYQKKKESADDFFSEKALELDQREAAVQEREDSRMKEVKNACDRMMEEAEQRRLRMLADTEEEITAKKTAADDYYNKKVSEAETKAQEYWDALSEKLEKFYAAHMGLRELLNGAGNMGK